MSAQVFQAMTKRIGEHRLWRIRPSRKPVETPPEEKMTEALIAMLASGHRMHSPILVELSCAFRSPTIRQPHSFSRRSQVDALWDRWTPLRRGLLE